MVVDKVDHAWINMTSWPSIDLASLLVVTNSFLTCCQDIRAQIELTLLIQFELCDPFIEVGATDANLCSERVFGISQFEFFTYVGA